VTRGIDPPEVEGYQWDGWKLIMIAKLNTDGTFHSRKWSCVWRPDVGSGLYARSDWMRAGGVGGVAWLQTGAVQSYSYGTGSGEVHVPLADHMGNVRHYYQFKASGSKVTGQLVASYEYDAFGREVRAWGLNTPATNQPPGLPASRPWADLLPFHYSSKLRDADSGFNYYGYRFYDPGAGRWLNRDPIEEEGGVNLYGMVGSDTVNSIDVHGLTGWQFTDAFGRATPGSPGHHGYEKTISGTITLQVSDLVKNAGTGTITLGVELSMTGQLRLDYVRLAAELESKGFSKQDANAARDALKAEFQKNQTALGKAITKQFEKQREQAGHVNRRSNPGKTNVKVNAQARVFKSTGRALAAVGIVFEIYNVANAPEDERGIEAARAVGRVGGGFLGGAGAGALGGSWGGPWGAVAGAILGGIGGSIAGEGAVDLVCPE
jgi:RHS repeat-associated protein